MQLLPIEFTGRKTCGEHTAFNFKQVMRKGKYAVYERSLEGSTTAPHYETIVIQSHNGRKIGGVEIPAAEFYPAATSWGSMGWTVSTKERALELLEQKLEAETAK
jgi:hypothetical protein